jgi:NADH-quinone oxidoreductase subunit L
MDLTLITWLIPVPPVLAFGLIVLFLNKWKRLSSITAILGMVLSFLMAQYVFWQSVVIGGKRLAEHPLQDAKYWLALGENTQGWFKMGVMVDPLTAVMLFFVSITCLCIFVYSYGYHNGGQPESKHNKKGEPPEVGTVEVMFSRFFAYLSLFAAAMLTLVVADNILLMFVGWEVMGLCSYLLIGFWFARKYPDPKKVTPYQAAIKAFMTTRVGDVLMLLGIAYVYSQTGTLAFREIFEPEKLAHLAETPSYIVGLSVAGLAGLLLFAGTVGKSSQFPLHVWLPDAMEGPTPVSAMIHAATMVSAGVYAMVRMFPLLHAGLGPEGLFTPPMLAMGLIGGVTALFASVIAIAQNDIKRVLAYSTIAQLGYMIAALGVGAWVAAAFHLVTHAFFKALLFLGSGSVIHGMEHGHHHAAHAGADHAPAHGEYFDPNDMLNMGGLRKKMPWTFWPFLIGGLSLSGTPLLTAGFWSKDAILADAFKEHLAGNGLGTFVFLVLAVSALLTAFYTMRMLVLTFFGKPRTEAAAHASESTWTMTLPLWVLAVFAFGAGFVGIEHELIKSVVPGLAEVIQNWFHDFVDATYESLFAFKMVTEFNPVPMLTSVGMWLVGLTGGILLYWRKPLETGQPDPLSRGLGIVYRAMQNRFYFDEIYNAVLIQPTLRLARWTYTFIDKVVIDGFLHGVARAAYRTGEAFRVFDRAVINGGADALADSIKAAGRSVRELQTGQIQNYLLFVLLITIILFVVFEIPLPGLR